MVRDGGDNRLLNELYVVELCLKTILRSNSIHSLPCLILHSHSCAAYLALTSVRKLLLLIMRIITL